MNFHSTTASFPVSTEPRALLSCANLPADSAFYDVSVPFGKLRAGSGSLLCYLSRGVFFYPTGQASSPRDLAASQLPFASNYCTLIILKYRGSLTGDLNPISSCPCRAYPKKSSRRKNARLILAL